MCTMPMVGAGEVVHETQRAVDQAHVGEPRVDEPAPLQQDEPRVAAHQQRGPDRKQHEEQQQRGDAGPRLGDDVGERIAEQDADDRDEERQLERRLQREQIGGMEQSRVVRQRQALGVAEREPEQPGDRGQRDDGDQQEAGKRQAAQHPLLGALLRPELGGIAASLPRQADRYARRPADDSHRRQASSAGTMMVSPGARPSVIGAPGDGRARSRAAGGVAHRDRLTVGQRHVEQRAFALVDELLHLAGKDVEAGAVRRIDDLQLLRPQHQELRGCLMPRRLCKLRAAGRRGRRRRP